MKRLTIVLAALFACGAEPEPADDAYTEEHILPVDEQRTVSFGIGCDSDTGECSQTWTDPDVDAHWGDPNWAIDEVENKAVCQGNEGQCFPCDTGVGCYSVPDNGVHTWCSLDSSFSTNLVHLNWGVENSMSYLDNTNSMLPSGFDLLYRGPNASYEPTLCAGLKRDCPTCAPYMAPVDPFNYPTHVDMIFAKRPLLTAANLAVTCPTLSVCPGANCNNPEGNFRWLACGMGKAASQGVTWNNGFGTNSFNRFAGWMMYYDHDAIVAWNARPAFDPNNTVNDATGIEYIYADVTCWLVGFTLGLKAHNDTEATRSSCNSRGLRNISNMSQGWQFGDTKELQNTYSAITWPDGWVDDPFTYAPPRGAFEY